MVFSIQNATTANQRALLQIKHDRNAVMQTAEIRAAQANGTTRIALSDNLQEALDYQSFVSETLVQIGLAYAQMHEVLYAAAANGKATATLPGELTSAYESLQQKMIALGTAKFSEGSQTFSAFSRKVAADGANGTGLFTSTNGAPDFAVDDAVRYDATTAASIDGTNDYVIGKIYYIKTLAGNNFSLSETKGGDALGIDSSEEGAGQTFTKVNYSTVIDDHSGGETNYESTDLDAIVLGTVSTDASGDWFEDIASTISTAVDVTTQLNLITEKESALGELMVQSDMISQGILFNKDGMFTEGENDLARAAALTEHGDIAGDIRDAKEAESQLQILVSILASMSQQARLLAQQSAQSILQ